MVGLDATVSWRGINSKTTFFFYVSAGVSGVRSIWQEKVKVARNNFGNGS